MLIELAPPSPRSPLRYPGGKARVYKEIATFFPNDLKEVCSPFIGGGSVELELAAKGIKVLGSDNFTPLTEFWQILLSTPHVLAGAVMRYYPITRQKFLTLKKEYDKIESKLERAAIFYVLNRSSYSGLTFQGGMSPDAPRFTIKGINALSAFRQKNISVRNQDWRVALKKNKGRFLYCDPPYMNSERLYGKEYNNANFEHEVLAAHLRERHGWILSYNDHRRVRRLYRGYPIFSMEWNYGLGKNKQSNEIIIIGI